MTDEEIIKKYYMGYPMSAIIDMYYAEINLNQNRITYIGNDRIINNDFMPRKEAQAHVESVIVQHLVQKKKERKEFQYEDKK